MRDAIEAAIETTAPAEAAAPAPAPAAAPPAPAAAAPERSSAAPAAKSPTEAAAAQDLNALAEGKPGDEQQASQPRDEKGKFAGKEGVQPGPKTGQPKQQGEKAPASWRPEAREHWAQLPEPVRAEIARRERETATTLQDTAEARRNVEAFARVLAPYEAMIRSENATPVQAIESLLSTAYQLRTAPPQQKAALVAGLVKQYGIDINMLDSALAGQAPAVDPQQAALQQALDQRLAPVQQMLSQFQQAQLAQQQQLQQSAQSEVEQFLGRAEFGADVREDMADILEIAHRRGQQMTLAEAYKKACMANDDVRKVLQQRARAKAAQSQTNAAQRARATAVQVSGSAPMGALKQEPTDIRGAIEAAIAMNSR